MRQDLGWYVSIPGLEEAGPISAGHEGGGTVTAAPLWVRGSWVPGTQDQVELTLEGGGERATVALGWVHRNLGEQYGHDLFLKGKTRFACNPGFWRALVSGANRG